MSSIVTSYIPTRAGAVDTRTADSINFPFLPRPQAMTVYVRFQERGSIYVTNGRLLHIGSGTANTQAFLLIERATTTYRADFQSGRGAALVSSTLSATVQVGDIVELVLTLTAAGVVQLQQSVNGAAITTATASAASILPSSWGAATLYLNSGATLANEGAAAFLNVLIVRGVESFATMRRLASVS